MWSALCCSVHLSVNGKNEWDYIPDLEQLWSEATVLFHFLLLLNVILPAPVLIPTTPAPTPPPAPEYHECYCKGDPHCRQFNSDVDMLIRGSCTHILTSDICPFSELGHFKLMATFKRHKPTSQRSFVHEMFLECESENGNKLVSKISD